MMGRRGFLSGLLGLPALSVIPEAPVSKLVDIPLPGDWLAANAPRFSAAVRKGMCEAIESEIGSSPKLTIYSYTGDKMELTVPSDWYSASPKAQIEEDNG